MSSKKHNYKNPFLVKEKTLAITICSFRSFSCSPPDLNFLDTYFIFMYVHNKYCHRATAHLHLNILLSNFSLLSFGWEIFTYPGDVVTCRIIVIIISSVITDRLCGLVVRVSGYRYRGPGFDPRRYQIF